MKNSSATMIKFTLEFIKSKSAAAAGLCSWVINIVKFFDVYCDVEPKRRALDEANAELIAARHKLMAVKNKVINFFFATNDSLIIS